MTRAGSCGMWRWNEVLYLVTLVKVNRNLSIMSIYADWISNHANVEELHIAG